MLKDNGRRVQERRNLHLTTEELAILFRSAEKMSSKLFLLIALCAFRGFRVSEACAINILDFKDCNFDRISYREAKVNKIQRDRPIIEPLARLIKAYVVTNRFSFKDGFLFSKYSSYGPHMTTKTVDTLFERLRKIIAKDHPSFLDRYELVSESGRKLYRYRITFHSLRRWFETHLNESSSPYIVKQLMDYSKFEPLNAYLNRFKVLDDESQILDKAFGPLFDELVNGEKTNDKRIGSFEPVAKARLPGN